MSDEVTRTREAMNGDSERTVALAPQLYTAAENAAQALDYSDQEWVARMFLRAAKEIDRMVEAARQCGHGPENFEEGCVLCEAVRDA